MRILVTGAAGFVGSHLCERLADLGHDVAGIDCYTDYYARVLKELNARDVEERGVPIHNLDLVEADLGPALEGAEVVYHVAAQPGISSAVPFDLFVRNNLTATHRVVEAVKEVDSLRGFIFVSTSSVYGAYATERETAPPKPTSYYGVTKLAAEQLALSYFRDYGLPVCSMRLYSVVGPRERPEKLYSRLIRSILEEEEFPLCEGSRDHTRSYTYVGDAVEAFVRALDRLDLCRGQIFNIGSEVEVRTGDGIDILERILGRRARMVLRPARPGDQQRTCAVIDKAREVLGYEPRHSLEDALREQVDWYVNKVDGKVRFQATA